MKQARTPNGHPSWPGGQKDPSVRGPVHQRSRSSQLQPLRQPPPATYKGSVTRIAGGLCYMLHSLYYICSSLNLPILYCLVDLRGCHNRGSHIRGCHIRGLIGLGSNRQTVGFQFGHDTLNRKYVINHSKDGFKIKVDTIF